MLRGQGLGWIQDSADRLGRSYSWTHPNAAAKRVLNLSSYGLTDGFRMLIAVTCQLDRATQLSDAVVWLNSHRVTSQLSTVRKVGAEGQGGDTPH